MRFAGRRPHVEAEALGARDEARQGGAIGALEAEVSDHRIAGLEVEPRDRRRSVDHELAVLELSASERVGGRTA